MSQLNTHIQVGRVGQLKEVGANLVITVCSNNPYKNGNGEWIDNPEWIEHTIFARQDFAHQMGARKTRIRRPGSSDVAPEADRMESG